MNKNFWFSSSYMFSRVITRVLVKTFPFTFLPFKISHMVVSDKYPMLNGSWLTTAETAPLSKYLISVKDESKPHHMNVFKQP